MYATTLAYDEAIRFSHRTITTVEWTLGMNQPWEGLTWMDGDVTCDSKAATRWSLNLQIPHLPDGFDALGTRIRVHRGLHIGRVGEFLVPWGIYRVDSIEESDTDVSITAVSFEKQIQDSRFPQPRRVGGVSKNNPEGEQGNFPASIVPGNTYREVIMSLVTEAVPDASFEFRTGAVDSEVKSFLQERDRWELLDGGNASTSISAALGVEMFFDGRGVFVVQDIPTLSDKVVWNADDADHPVVVTPVRNQSREGVYNMVVAAGQSTTGAPPVGPGVAWDNNPTSRTYAGPDPMNHPELASSFGVVPMFMVSPFLYTVPQCNRAAFGQLQRKLGLKETLSFTQMANYALEAGDVIVQNNTRSLISSWSCSLTGTSMECQTAGSTDDEGDIDLTEDEGED